MTIYSEIYVNILLDSIGIITSVILLLMLLLSEDRKNRLGWLFIRLALCNTGMIAFDLISWLCTGRAWGYAILVDRAAVFLSYALSFLLIPLLTDYIVLLIGKKTKATTYISRAMYIYFGFILLLVIVSQFNDMFYYYDNNNMYRHGELFWLSQVFAPLYIVFITAVIYRYRKSIGRSNSVFLLVYIFFPFVAAILAIFSPQFEYHFIATTISLITCYGGIQVRQVRQAVRLTQTTLKSLGNIMDSINTSIYVIEPETCRLLFVNKWLKAFYGRENDDLSGKFCYKEFRGFDEMCSFCPCPRLAENPKQTLVWEEFFEPYGIYVRHLFCYIDWPNGERAILHYGIDTTEIHEKMDLLVKVEKQERELAENRMSIMLSQIQPHFLYNALSAIQDLCVEDPVTAEKMVVEFSQYLRGNLDSLGLNRPIPFERELGHVETYLAIEKKRFDENLNIAYEIRTRNFTLPALSLQLIVENAVRHGVTKRSGGGTVLIKTEETGTAYVITVEDDGVGFDPDEKIEDGRSHVGIKNVRSRLDAMCGGTLTIHSSPGKGTTAVITIPKKDKG